MIFRQRCKYRTQHSTPKICKIVWERAPITQYPPYPSHALFHMSWGLRCCAVFSLSDTFLFCFFKIKYQRFFVLSESRMRKCDSNCDSRGCWGPGPKNCVACQHWKLKDECVQKCPEHKWDIIESVITIGLFMRWALPNGKGRDADAKRGVKVVWENESVASTRTGKEKRLRTDVRAQRKRQRSSRR